MASDGYYQGPPQGGSPYPSQQFAPQQYPYGYQHPEGPPSQYAPQTQPPPQYSPQQQPQYAPQQQQQPVYQNVQSPQAHGPITFRFSNNMKEILNSQVTDPWGRTVLTISSTKKQTVVTDGERRSVATIEWHHDTPKMSYHGNEMKVKEWLPWDTHTKTRSFQHNGQLYKWVTGANGSPELVPTAGRPIVTIAHPEHIVEVTMYPEAFQAGVFMDSLLSVIFFYSDRPIGDIRDKSLDHSLFLGNVIGALLGV